MNSVEPRRLNLCLATLKQCAIVKLRVCTEEGDRGDEYGFGVEPDMWASALFDFEGSVIQPFALGYISGPRDEY